MNLPNEIRKMMDRVAAARSVALQIEIHTDEGCFDNRMASETYNRLDSLLTDLNEWRVMPAQQRSR
jgi:hypothetical protein